MATTITAKSILSGMDLSEQDNNETGAEEEYVLDPNEPEPVVIAPFHFVLLSLASMGLYLIWWQFKCWTYFNAVENIDKHVFSEAEAPDDSGWQLLWYKLRPLLFKIWHLPALRAVLFVFFGIELFNKIQQYCLRYDHKVSYNPILIWLTCIGINALGYLQIPFSLLSSLAFAPIVLPVQELNFYFTGNKNGYRDDKLNDRQILLLLMGLFFWTVLIYGLLHPEIQAPKK